MYAFVHVSTDKKETKWTTKLVKRMKNIELYITEITINRI